LKTSKSKQNKEKIPRRLTGKNGKGGRGGETPEDRDGGDGKSPQVLGNRGSEKPL